MFTIMYYVIHQEVFCSTLERHRQQYRNLLMISKFGIEEMLKNVFPLKYYYK